MRMASGTVPDFLSEGKAVPCFVQRDTALGYGTRKAIQSSAGSAL